MKTENVKLSQVQINSANPRKIKDKNFDKLVDSVLVLPKMLELRPVVVDNTMTVLGGNMRYRALCAIADLDEQDIRNRLNSSKDFHEKTQAERDALVEYWLSWKDNPTVEVANASKLSDAEKREFIIKDNVNFGEWDFDTLANEWDNEELDDWGVDVWQEENDAKNNEGDSVEASPEGGYEPLTKDFFVFPQTVLDTRRGEWQGRKRKWLEMGITSETGRDDELTFAPTCLTPADSTRVTLCAKEYGITKTEAARILLKKGEVSLSTTSIFDPVLCEVCYRWFNIDGGKILDPFAGGSVRGIVAGALGMPYFGNDLREEQVRANRQNLSDVSRREDFGNANPIWTVGDSLNIVDIMRDAGQKEFDMIFSCPPYADLEVYSDKKEDLSNMEYGEFVKLYREIISESCSMLKDNRFACFVIGDVRDKKGWSRNLVNDTILAFELAGLHYYNQLILVNQVGSAAIRARGAYKTRKIVKTHQNVVVAYKGDNCKDISRDFPIQGGIQSLIDNVHEDDVVEI